MFHLDSYSSKIQSILQSHEAGRRLMPLAPRSHCRAKGSTCSRICASMSCSTGSYRRTRLCRMRSQRSVPLLF